MEIVFFAVLMGCSDDLSICDEVKTYEVAAESREACAEMTLASTEAMRADYPMVTADCRKVDEPLLVADSSAAS